MRTLLSKVQYRHFEPGEFVEAQPRALDETLALLHAFPWPAEQEGLRVGLTSPSVTIEGLSGEFLKCARFYNGAFVLYYYDKGGELFQRSLRSIAEADPYVERFFSRGAFALEDFQKQGTWMKELRKHFVTGAFRYPVNPVVLRRFIWRRGRLILLVPLFLLIFVAAGQLVFSVLASLLYCLVGFGFPAALGLYFYRHSRGRCLVLSRGQDVFYYGTPGALRQFDKRNIRSLTIVRKDSEKQWFEAYSIAVIEMTDGHRIQVPSLQLSADALREKLRSVPVYWEDRWPRFLPG